MPPTGKNIPQPNAGKQDPILTYQFAVEIITDQGTMEARFRSAKGFAHTTKAIEHREVDPTGKIYVNKTIGATSWADITLQRGFTSDNQLWNKLRQSVMNGEYDKARCTVHIKGMDPAGNPVTWFSLSRAWISSWKGPAFDATTGSTAIEEVTFTHEAIVREDLAAPSK